MEEPKNLYSGFGIFVELAKKPMGFEPFPSWKDANVGRVTRPLIILQLLDQTGFKRIPVNIAGQSEGILLRIHQRALVAILKQITDSSVSAVKVLGVLPLQIVHCFA